MGRRLRYGVRYLLHIQRKISQRKISQWEISAASGVRISSISAHINILVQ